MDMEIANMVRSLRDNKKYTYRRIADIVREETGKRISFQYVAVIDKITKQDKIVKANCHFTHIRRWMKTHCVSVEQFAQLLDMPVKNAKKIFFCSEPKPLSYKVAMLVEAKTGIPAERAAKFDRAYARYANYGPVYFANEKKRAYAHHGIAYSAVKDAMNKENMKISDVARAAQLAYSTTYSILVGKYGEGLENKAEEKIMIAEALGLDATQAYF